MNKKILGRAFLLLAGAAIPFSLIAVSAKAADLKMVVPGGAVTNRASTSGTWFIKAFDNGTPEDITDDQVYVDFQPPGNSDFEPDPDFTGPTGTTGIVNYGFLDGIGALDEFESSGLTGSQALILDTVFPAFVPTGGRDFSVPGFIKLDDQSVPNPLDPGAGLNNFDMTRIDPVSIEFTADGTATTVDFTVEGIFTGPETGPLNGQVSFVSTFTGQTPDEIRSAIFDPGFEPPLLNSNQNSLTAEAAKVPESSGLMGLGVVAFFGILGLKRRVR